MFYYFLGAICHTEGKVRGKQHLGYVDIALYIHTV